MTHSISTAPFIINEPDGTHSMCVLVDGIRCAGCIANIERTLKEQADIVSARVNFSTRRLKIIWRGGANLADTWVSLVQGLGFRTMPYDPAVSEAADTREEKFLLKCLAVAGFASGNLMLFSIPLWTSDSVEMTAATRSMFQWVQAFIAMPAIIYCGLPFYKSAWAALKEYRTNMDVPISVAVVLATAMSLFETYNHGEHAYFDSGVMLLFFLLIGRYLDARARGQARSAAKDLLHMMQGFATVLHSDGRHERVALGNIETGMILVVAAGEKIGADGEVITGVSEIDTSLITGETLPQTAIVGSKLFAGTLNIAAPLTMRVTQNADQSLLAEIIRLMETAEQSQAKYVTIADQISSWYTPAVHALAAITFLGWLWFGGAPWQVALLYAATVLIITCPCALGLAVPVVQVLATGKLMRMGVLIKSGSALERLATITHVVLDKTGTLTLGHPELVDAAQYSQSQLQLAASVAVHSKHPLSRAVCRAYSGALLPVEHVQEIAGQGLQAGYNGHTIRLGKAGWSGAADVVHVNDHALELWLYDGDTAPLRFAFTDALREDAAQVVQKLQSSGLTLTMLSGDRPKAVNVAAQAVGITNALAHVSPVEKSQYLQTLAHNGAHVLMVGDGLNDAPSLAAAQVSMSPASAADIAQNAADIVFQGDKFAPVYTTWRIAKFSQVLVKQNFALAMLYNIVAIPLAMAGYVTPIIAAIAMSSSSIIVVLNALRLNIYEAK